MNVNVPVESHNLRLVEKEVVAAPGRREVLVEFALQQGAAEAASILPDLVVVSEQVRYKCQYGCRHYQRNKMCPPETPPIVEFRTVVRCYDNALLVRTAPETLHELILTLEREAFLHGHVLALGLIESPCLLCQKCPGPNVPCLQPQKARPSMEAMGINVFRTCANAGIELRVLTNPAERYLATGLVLF
ncbi:MAG TPA: hypothetical protein DEP84_11450 [Chloroflexi bacterium]|nr:hypothetical protein [Chloroflexota bacterium]